jgi:hypothetical protein
MHANKVNGKRAQYVIPGHAEHKVPQMYCSAREMARIRAVVGLDPRTFMYRLLGVYTLRAGRPRFYSREVQEIFLYYTASRPALGPTQPPLRWIPGLKRQGLEADRSPPSSA